MSPLAIRCGESWGQGQQHRQRIGEITLLIGGVSFRLLAAIGTEALATAAGSPELRSSRNPDGSFTVDFVSKGQGNVPHRARVGLPFRRFERWTMDEGVFWEPPTDQLVYVWCPKHGDLQVRVDRIHHAIRARDPSVFAVKPNNP